MDGHPPSMNPAETMDKPGNGSSNEPIENPFGNQAVTGWYFALATQGPLAINHALSSTTTNLRGARDTAQSSTLNVAGTTEGIILTERPHPYDGEHRVMAAPSDPVQLGRVLPCIGRGRPEIDEASIAPNLETDQGYITFGALGITLVNSVDARGGSGGPRDANDPSSTASRTMLA